MRNEYRWFDLTPKIVPIHQPVTITIHPTGDEIQLIEGCTYAVSIIPMEEKGGQRRQTLLVRPIQGNLVIQYTFEDEQEYVLLIEEAPGEYIGCADWKLPRSEFRIYALDEDLFVRRPFKGDFHMHSNFSDGKEPPAFVAASCRLIGLDFMAVTDHRQYQPSLEALSAFQNIPHDLKIYPGEEVHPPENRVHMVNFGGRFSINDWFREFEPIYRKEVAAIQATLDFPDDSMRLEYASCLWCYDKIRQAGGIGIFCHPYWVTSYAYNVPEPIIASHLEQQPYDAYEIIGGMHFHETESNWLQAARYHEMQSQGHRLRIVGVSDAHGCKTGELFGWYYTVVLAHSSNLDDIREGIYSLNTVAIENLPNDFPRVHGPFRLVKYVQFLLREVFPVHDDLCKKEGQLMLAYMNGDPAAEAGLKECSGQVERFYQAQYASGW